MNELYNVDFNEIEITYIIILYNNYYIIIFYYLNKKSIRKLEDILLNTFINKNFSIIVFQIIISKNCKVINKLLTLFYNKILYFFRN